MRIVRKEIERSGRNIHVAWIDTQGIDLGIDTISNGIESSVPEPEFVAVRDIDKRTPITINDDDEDASLELLPEDYLPVLPEGEILNLDKIYFCIDTYKKLATDPIEVWTALLKPANDFLTTLNEEDTKLLCLFYIDVRKVIDEELIVLRGSLSDVANTIGNMLYDLSAIIHLPAKLIYHCKNYGIPIPDLAYAGTRPGQDREEMTFKEEDYIRVMAITILCKLLCPIWGDLIFRTIKLIDTMQKETQCAGVINSLLSTELFVGTQNKLFNYIAAIVDREFSQSYANASFTATIGGFSKDKFHQSVYSMILVKRYVNVDLYKTKEDTNIPDGNLMIWTSTCAKQSFTSTLNTLNKNCHVMKRVDISDGPDRGDEESNVSVLEHSSRVTTVTADVPVLIRHGVNKAINLICREYQVSALDLDIAMKYYQQYPIQVTLFNKILVGLLIGNKIGGAHGLKYLDHLAYTKLVVITQIYIANHLHSSLVHLITATTPSLSDPNPTNQKSTPSSIDARIETLFKGSGEYRNCEEVFQYSIDNISMAGILLRIKDNIIKHIHYANTAPNICTTMDQDPIVPGSIVVYDEMVMRNFCHIILQILSKEKHNTMGIRHDLNNLSSMSRSTY